MICTIARIKRAVYHFCMANLFSCQGFETFNYHTMIPKNNGDLLKLDKIQHHRKALRGFWNVNWEPRIC